VFAVAASSCGGRTSLSCNNAATFACLTISVSSGLALSNASCTSGSVEISECPTAGVIGTCTIVTQVTSPTTGTSTQVARLYTGGDLAAGQAGCPGTWTTP
jgi:hypothetical protein